MGNCLRRGRKQERIPLVTISPREEREFVCRACNVTRTEEGQRTQVCSPVPPREEILQLLSRNRRLYEEIELIARRGDPLPLYQILNRGHCLINMHIHLERCEWTHGDERRDAVEFGLLNWISAFETSVKTTMARETQETEYRTNPVLMRLQTQFVHQLEDEEEEVPLKKETIPLEP